MSKKDCCTLWFDFKWWDCCCQHDVDYSSKMIVTRKEADKYLKDCVKASGYPVVSLLMFISVRLFGWIFYKK